MSRVAQPVTPGPVVGEAGDLAQAQIDRLVAQGFNKDEIADFMGTMRPKTPEALSGDRAAASATFKESERLTKKAATLAGVEPGDIRKTGRARVFEALKEGEKGAVHLDVANDVNLTDELVATIGLPRALKTTLDLSAPGRQGLALAFRHPKEWGESWLPMIRAWRSEDGMQAVNKQIDSMMAAWRNDLGDDVVHFYDVGPQAEGLERVPGFEAAGKGYVSAAVRKIPGLSNSERAYATFLNYQKARTFDTMATSLLKAGDTNTAHYQNLGRIIDHATGYGAAPLKGRLEGQALFSQRYMLSRFQFLLDPIVEGLRRGDLKAAQAAMENLVAFGGGMAAILMLGHETGAWDATLDVRSSDFGKIRVGPQRIDFGGGFLPILRTAGRIATGEAKSISGDVYDIDPKTELLKFFRNKLAPIPSEVVTRLVGENPIGEKPSKVLSLETARQLFMPLIADSVLEAYKETGDPIAALRAFGTELVGGGTSTYGSGQALQVQMADEQHGQEYDSLFAEQQAEINRQLVEAGTKLPFRDRDGPWWQARDDALSRWQADLEAELADEPFVQQALKVERTADLEEELTKWAREAYEVSRVEAEAAVTRFLNETKLDDYVRAYRKGVLSADPDYIAAWLEAYEKGETEYAPPKWAKDFIAEEAKQTPVGAGR